MSQERQKGSLNPAHTGPIDANLSQLGDAIDRRKADIEDRWTAQIREDARAFHVGTTALKDGIGEYLRRIAETLRGTPDYRASGAWRDIASEHALTRIRIGFDIDQLVRELVALRRITLDVLREEHELPPDQSGDQLTNIIEVALVASVKSYTQARDYELRRQEAEHVAFLAHKVRSPLTAALLSMERARGQLQDAKDCGQALERAERNLLRLQELLDDVLVIQSLEAGAQPPIFTKVKVGEVLDDVISAARQAAENKGLEFEVRYDPELEIQSDAKLLVSAIEPLLENAVKYTDTGPICLDIRETSEHLECHVSDNCPGLSEQELSIIFEPFKRGQSGKAGSGLGLAIVRQAVRALGGEVHAESPGERGCHFWFAVPLTPH